MIQPIALLNATASPLALSPIAIGEAVFDLSLAVLPDGAVPRVQPLAAPGKALPQTLAIALSPTSAPALDLAVLSMPVSPSPGALAPTSTLEPMPLASIPMDEKVRASDDAPPAEPALFPPPITRMLTAERAPRTPPVKPHGATSDSPSDSSPPEVVQDAPATDLADTSPTPIASVATPTPAPAPIAAGPALPLPASVAPLAPDATVPPPHRAITNRPDPSTILPPAPLMRPAVAPLAASVSASDPSISPNASPVPDVAPSPPVRVASDTTTPVPMSATPASDVLPSPAPIASDPGPALRHPILSRTDDTLRTHPSTEIASAPVSQPIPGLRWTDRRAEPSEGRSEETADPGASDAPLYPTRTPAGLTREDAATPAQAIAATNPIDPHLASVDSSATPPPVVAKPKHVHAQAAPSAPTLAPLVPSVTSSASPVPRPDAQPAIQADDSLAKPVTPSSPSGPGAEVPDRQMTSTAVPELARAVAPARTSPRIEPSAASPIDHVAPAPIVAAPVATAPVTTAPEAPATPVIAAPAPVAQPLVAGAPPVTTASQPTPASPIAATAEITTTPESSAPATDRQTETAERPVPAPEISARIPLPVSEAPRLVAGAAAPAFRLFAAAIHAARADEDDRVAPPTITSATTVEQARAPLPVARAQSGTLDMTDHRWPHAMVEQIERLQDQASATRDAASTSIRLVPDALGTIDVAVRRDGETVHVHFTAEQAQTRALIADAQPRLQELAEAKGIRLAQAALGTNVGTGADGQAQRQPTPRAPGRPAPAPAARGDEPAIPITDRVA